MSQRLANAAAAAAAATVLTDDGQEALKGKIPAFVLRVNILYKYLIYRLP